MGRLASSKPESSFPERKGERPSEEPLFLPPYASARSEKG
jgi:hypothetical protein